MVSLQSVYRVYRQPDNHFMTNDTTPSPEDILNRMDTEKKNMPPKRVIRFQLGILYSIGTMLALAIIGGLLYPDISFTWVVMTSVTLGAVLLASAIYEYLETAPTEKEGVQGTP